MRFAPPPPELTGPAHPLRWLALLALFGFGLWWLL